MTPTQAQDLIDTFGKAVFLNQMDQEQDRDALLDAVNKILEDRAMLLEALEDAKAKLEWFVDSYPQDVATSRYDFFATIRAAIAQCEGKD